MTAEIASTPQPSRDVALVTAVAALPLPTNDADRRWNMRTTTVEWLRSRGSDHTRRAYFGDLEDFLGWCRDTGLDPREAVRADVDEFVASRCAALTKTSRARRLSTLSSWYRYLMSNGAAGSNPVLAVDRPKVNRDDSATVGLTAAEVTAFMRAARVGSRPASRRDAAILAFLAELGLRVGEALNLDLAHLGYRKGHRAVTVYGKGNRRRTLPVTAPLARDLDAYLEARAAVEGVEAADLTGPVFVTATGARVDPGYVFRLVRRVAEAAGLPSAAGLSPHSLRHTAATAALDKGAQLRDVQDFMGHADPRTTRRYDRDRGSLDRSPAYLIAGLFAHDHDEGDGEGQASDVG